MKNSIFFGNGINRLSSRNISWNALLDNIKEGRRFQDDRLPNTMIYERIIMERPPIGIDVLYDEFRVKEEISRLMNSIDPCEIYTDLFQLDCDNFITTNYDYAFIESVRNLPNVKLPIYEFSTEDVYSIRRLKEIRFEMQLKKDYWQIHGEIRKPATIMLGLDHYCGSIGKIDNYIKGGYKYQNEHETVSEISMQEKLIDQTFNKSSWIELFFTSNIHILGFTFDFSEVDLWWILNKRARMKRTDILHDKISNKIYYYCSEIDEQKKGLFESLGIEVIITNLSDKESKYFDYYKDTIKKIKRKIASP